MLSVPSVALFVSGVIHLLPLSGVLGGRRLAALYGVADLDPTVELLLRHRAVSFGLLGALFLRAAFAPALQPFAIAVGLAATLSFVLLARGVTSANARIARVARVDVVCALALLAGALVSR